MYEQAGLGNLRGLVELGKRDGVDVRPTLLRVSTDLYVAKKTHSIEEERQYTELALRLIDLVDAPTRAAVAKRLASYSAAPPAVVARLSQIGAGLYSEPEPTSLRLDDPNPSNNTGDDLNVLFFSANPEERKLILLNLDYGPLPGAAPIARELASRTVRSLEAAALAHNTELCVQELQNALAISRDRARQIIEDASGEPIVVAAMLLGMPAAILQRILLCLNPSIGQSVQRVYELAALYEEIELSSALKLMTIWRAGTREKSPPLAQKPAHQPYHTSEAPVRGTQVLPTRPKIRWDDFENRKAEQG